MYAIMGITGRVGGAIAENLLAQGIKFARSFGSRKGRAMEDRGAEIAIADFDDPNALASAFEGMDGVFVMAPAELCAGSRLSGNAQDSGVLSCSSRKGSAEKSGISFFDRGRTDQRVGTYHQFASPGANPRRSAHRPRIPEGRLVHGKSRLGRYYSKVRRKDLL